MSLNDQKVLRIIKDSMSQLKEDPDLSSSTLAIGRLSALSAASLIDDEALKMYVIQSVAGMSKIKKRKS